MTNRPLEPLGKATSQTGRSHQECILVPRNGKESDLVKMRLLSGIKNHMPRSPFNQSRDLQGQRLFIAFKEFQIHMGDPMPALIGHDL